MVNVQYRNALTEVDEILNITEKSLIEQIPNIVIKFIKENRNNNYKVNISENIPLENQKLLQETEAILSLLYRSYWATKEEKDEFTKQDNIELKKIEEEKREKYTEDIFQKNKQRIEPTECNNTKNINMQLIKTDALPWYKRIYMKIKSYYCKFWQRNSK